jgi:hypothetical protein
MHAVQRFPVYAVGNACLVAPSHELEPGERVLDLDIEVDMLPPSGRLCVSEHGVRMMCNELGLSIDDGREIDELQATIERLRDENDELREAIAQTYNVAKLVNLGQILADAS